ncbi:MAG: phosphoribosylanthranilate isomerase [Agarilytica sp.]
MSVRVKICGITRPEDSAYAAQCGADAIGIVFYPPSSRYVADLALARDIALAAGPFVNVVGLFVNADAKEVEDTIKTVPLSLMQFHGDESAEICERAQRPYIKALRMKEGLDLVAQCDLYTNASGFLLDTYVKGQPGGTGERFDWQRVPQNTGRPLIVAGGLTPSNVSQAIAQTRPYAVDVSGGVESSPGIKSNEKVRAFIEKAKQKI